jgi:hypothetical protein
MLVFCNLLFYQGIPMAFTSVLPAIAAALFVLFTVTVMVKDDGALPNIWLLPAILSGLFLLLSLQAIAAEGPWGFWVEHTHSWWGNQIWLDLLLAGGIGWSLAVPQAKALGMRPLPWLVLVLCTGCIGLLAMVARLLYLQENAEQVG